MMTVNRISPGLLTLIARASTAELLDGTKPVGTIRVVSAFEGPDAEGWYTGNVAIDPDTLEYTFPVPDPSDPTAILNLASTHAPVSIKLDSYGEVVYRCSPGFGMRDWTSSALPDFDVSAFSPILRERKGA